MLKVKEILGEIYFGSYDEKDILEKVGNSSYKVVEISVWDRYIFKELYLLELQGILPIIKCPEKIKEIKQDQNLINHFIDANCLFMLDMNSLIGKNGASSKKIAIKFIKHNIYNFISKIDEGFDESCKELDEYINTNDIISESYNKLINNEYVDFVGVKTKYKKVLGFI